MPTKKRRSIYEKYTPAVQSPANGDGRAALWFAFCNDRLLVREADTGAMIPTGKNLADFGLTPLRCQYLGEYDGTPCYAAELPQDDKSPEGLAFYNLRRLFDLLEEDVFLLAGKAKQIVEWDRDHQFCSRCGEATVPQAEDRSKRCPRCGLRQYPRLAPAIIVAVTKGNQILLAHAARFPRSWYSVLAGFVEPGETLEEAVRREVFEEVGIRVRRIRYFGSQPWPFPHSLMIGFTAEYAGGDLVLEEREIDDAKWFTVDNLPQISGKISIARRLIDHFIDSKTQG